MMKGYEAPLIIKHRAPGAAGLSRGPVVYYPLIPVEQQVIFEREG
jgi:hypothetical protein